MPGGLRIAVNHRIPLVTEVSCVVSIIGVGRVREGSHLHCQLGITNGAREIITAKSNGSAKGDEKSRIDSVSPLRTEALAGGG